MEGGSRSSTTTAKEHGLVLPAISLAAQATVLVPTEKVEPLGGVHTMVTLVSQLSLAVTVKVTLLFEHWPVSAIRSRLLEQMMVGAVVSTTVTVAVQLLEAPRLSVTVSVRDVLPRGYGPAGY